MKKLSSAIAITAVLLVSSSALGAPPRDRDRDRDRITNPKAPIMTILKRLFGVATLDEQLGPPKP